jgi:uncharacterized phage-associated protein
MAYSAAIIAYAFVKKGIEDGNPVTQMKLQKLVYFAHGLHLALYGEPLISEKFQAWKFGPVVPAIYHEYKFYGSSPIVNTDLLFLFGDVEQYDEALAKLDSKAKKAIALTWGALKDSSAIQLSNWTHKKDSPWEKNYTDGVSDIVIPNEEIQKYFKEQIPQPQVP